MQPSIQSSWVTYRCPWEACPVPKAARVRCSSSVCSSTEQWRTGLGLGAVGGRRGGVVSPLTIHTNLSLLGEEAAFLTGEEDISIDRNKQNDSLLFLSRCLWNFARRAYLTWRGAVSTAAVRYQYIVYR